MSKELIKCPICATFQPSEVDFCVYCNTLFDKDTIKTVINDDTKDILIEKDNNREE